MGAAFQAVRRFLGWVDEPEFRFYRRALTEADPSFPDERQSRVSQMSLHWLIRDARRAGP
jgi:hypothetical protein